jgi:uncharacterized protein (TIGR03435 family)
MRLAALLLLGACALAQQFEVASVKEMKPEQLGYGSEKIVVHPGSVGMRNARFRTVVKWAYDVKEFQVSAPTWMGAPGWQGGDLDRYEVNARAADGTPVPELRKMMQTLLVERFHLALHRESREMTVLVMTAPQPKPALHPAANPDGPPRITPDGSSLLMTGMSMADLAEFMAGPLHIPVLDRTGLDGRFDFSVAGPSRSDENFEHTLSMLVELLDQQLGLKLQRQKTPIEILVIDRADRKPTAN